MKVVSIVGARPEFIQASPVSRALRENHHHEIVVHTGQHYDYVMSAVFFDELGIPAPDYNLGVGSTSAGRQTAEILIRMEDVLVAERPDLVVVRGDTNSTLAGGIAASRLGITVAHIEAGERSYVREMPEEINRVVCDHLADLHLCASRTAVRRLATEGITQAVHWVGDVMLDSLLQNLPIARRRSDALARLHLDAGAYALATVHRAGNTDDAERLRQISAALNGAPEPVVFPAHPRTRSALARAGIQFAPHVLLIEPLGYYDMLVLEENARLIVTDSGGVTREAYNLSVPCLTLREETEWVETVAAGWNQLVGADSVRILDAWSSFAPLAEHPPLFGDGAAAVRIASILEDGIVSPRRPMPLYVADPTPAPAVRVAQP